MIGVFDSGIGGLTVVRELMAKLPTYDIVYLGDTARTPYGNKSPETIQQYAKEDVAFLVSQGATMIIIACNSASATAYSLLTTHYQLPIFDVIIPAARRAVEITKIKRIGVIGTRATIASGAYKQAIHAIDPSIVVVSQACPLFVSLIEEGWGERGETKRIVRLSLQGLKTHTIDTLVLGCTHYPLIRSTIQTKIGRKKTLVDPAQEVVRDVQKFLGSHPSIDQTLSKNGRQRFFVTDVTDHFHAMAQQWLKRGVRLEKARW